MSGPRPVDGTTTTGATTGASEPTAPVEPQGQQPAGTQPVEDALETGTSTREPQVQPQGVQKPGSTNVQRSFALLAARHSTDPFARSYRHGSIPRANFDASPQVRNAYYNSVFTADERAKIDAYYRLPLEERRERADEIRQLANTPDKVAALLGAKFTWVDEHDGAETWSMTEMIATGRGVCRDQHNAARAILESHGYEAYEVGYADGNANHAVCVFKNDDGKWYLMDYDGLIHPEGANSRRELLEGIDAGNFAWRVYEKTDGRPSAYSEKIWTRAGLQTLGFMYGTASGDMGLSALSPGRFNNTATRVFSDGWAVGTEATNEHATVSGYKGPWQLDLRMFTPAAGTTMEDAFGAAVRFNPVVRQDDPSTFERDNGVLDAGVSLSLMHLPNRGSRRVGGGGSSGTFPLSMVGIAGHTTLQPYQWEAVDDHLFLTGELNLRGAAALGYNHGTGGLDTSTGELANANVTWSNLLQYQLNDPSDRWGLRAYAGPTVNMDIVQAASHYVSGGRGTPPFNAYVEGGVEAAYENFALGGRLYMPLETTSNLFREDAAWDIYGGFHHNDFRFLAGVSGSLEGESLEQVQGGIGWRFLSLQAGRDLRTGETTGLIQASFDF